MTTTVLFADLTGSTRIFEAMGNERATETVTQITQWIGRVCERHQGRVVKKLGDGVLAVFRQGPGAVAAAVELQRSHAKRLKTWPLKLRMELKIGVASGEIVEVDGDCYGDAINIAARLSDLAGPEQIWATDAVVTQLRSARVRHRNLGPISIRGRHDAPVVHRVDWQEDAKDQLTQPAPLPLATAKVEPGTAQIELSWLNTQSIFSVEQFPVQLGRLKDVDFVVNDPRVSRLHASLEIRNGRCVLVDISTYGTWVRFRDAAGNTSEEIALRREECVLHGSGDIGLGAPLSDFTAPTISFRVASGNLELVRR